MVGLPTPTPYTVEKIAEQTNLFSDYVQDLKPIFVLENEAPLVGVLPSSAEAPSPAKLGWDSLNLI